jgi:hypothetical protein
MNQPRKPPSPSNRVEVLKTTAEEMSQEINEALKRNSTLKLVGTSMKEAGEGKFLVLLAFTSP